MDAKLHHQRPKHLNLFKINQPLPAIVSILHRISGVLLFFPGIPLLLCGLQQLLESPQGFEVLLQYLQSPAYKILLLLPVWFFLHHLCAGIRHLMLDLHLGVSLAQARTGSKLVLAAGVLLTLWTGLLLW